MPGRHVVLTARYVKAGPGRNKILNLRSGLRLFKRSGEVLGMGDLETIETILKRRGIEYTKESVNLGFCIRVVGWRGRPTVFSFTGSGELLEITAFEHLG